ncbi:lipoamide acyltransferase component of branched-chain alpha-keto acid dehydrogenase complex, mitochondrial isoform X1 [Arachis hypogaea]|uniref:lipoamide acyltransferase component of branched-chain alpha-keto acid dehydrogenase complex, mitochondrial isoform X1 n=1 Tax=Arachis hypogaea TaxID=3818 RepID=UPI0007AFB6B0|nr:lipoamide acyltransferase component of branched-chain alpha-keto acid dehydrogenase complex, mitochondrial isoform X1 [Arachis hypogaea]
MSLAAKVPHFHYVDEIKCNALVELKTAFQKNNPYPDVKHTFLPILVKSLSMALTKYPSLNSCFKEDLMEVIFKGLSLKHYRLNSRYVLLAFFEGSHNIGVAMATPNGLVVPNIKNVQSLSILQLARGTGILEKLAGEKKSSFDGNLPQMDGLKLILMVPPKGTRVVEV